MHSGLSRRSLTKADQSAGINPYDGKSLYFLFFSYQQHFVDPALKNGRVYENRRQR
jgi:hypothetical protein